MRSPRQESHRSKAGESPSHHKEAKAVSLKLVDPVPEVRRDELHILSQWEVDRREAPSIRALSQMVMLGCHLDTLFIDEDIIDPPRLTGDAGYFC